MEDHHVDRLGVEAQQCVKLTSTNRSIGLIAFIVSAHLSLRHRPSGRLEREEMGWLRPNFQTKPFFAGLVILAERLHPIPSRTRP